MCLDENGVRPGEQPLDAAASKASESHPIRQFPLRWHSKKTKKARQIGDSQIIYVQCNS